MEKLIYLVTKSANQSSESFSADLRGALTEKLLANGAHKLQINVVDATVAPAAPLRQIRTNSPFDGFVALWIDSLPSSCDRGNIERTCGAVCWLRGDRIRAHAECHATRTGRRAHARFFAGVYFASTAAPYLCGMVRLLAADAWHLGDRNAGYLSVCAKYRYAPSDLGCTGYRWHYRGVFPGWRDD